MKIDYVIPYVDGTDPAWLDLYEKYAHLNPNGSDRKEIRKRFSPNRLFKYQFRGLEKFAPWIDTVHLLVQSESQVPAWLDRGKVHVVLHKDFIPEEFLPTYNSSSFECFLHRIPGLAPCFIYANDDTYLLNSVKPSDFFDGCMPVNSLVKAKVHETYNESFQRMNMKITEFVCKELGLEYEPWTYLIPLHCQKAMNRQVLERIYAKYEDYIRSKVTTFRCDDNLSQAFFTVYYCLSTGMKWVDNGRTTYRRFDIFTDYDRIIRFFMSEHKDLPQMFCLNNNDNEKDVAVMCQFEKIFPAKSRFET